MLTIQSCEARKVQRGVALTAIPPEAELRIALGGKFQRFGFPSGKSI